MNGTPKGNRLQIGIFGRVNSGKSSLLNLLCGQDAALTSPIAGTTTDVVERAMELLPIGPVLFLDTAGFGDETVLGAARITRSSRTFDRAALGLLVIESGTWGEVEEEIVTTCRDRRIPLIGIVNKCDRRQPSGEFVQVVATKVKPLLRVSAIDVASRDAVLKQLKAAIAEALPNGAQQPPLVSDLIPPGGIAVLVVPIDLQAPKGRLILPQVQTIRETLDVDAAAIVVKERELALVLNNLRNKPDLVVCDSQSILKVSADVPRDVLCTTFSILFARAKGDLVEAARGAAAIEHLRAGDPVLIAEGCTHHALEDDIGRVKIPRWLRQYVGGELQFDFVSGCSFPRALDEYALVIHCGACTLNRNEMLSRVAIAQRAHTPITNYGMAIASVQGVLPRVLAPFPAALDAFESARLALRGPASAPRTVTAHV